MDQMAYQLSQVNTQLYELMGDEYCIAETKHQHQRQD